MSVCSQCFADVPPEAKRVHLLREHPQYAAKRGAKWDVNDVPDDRVRDKIARPGEHDFNGCWIWTGARNPNGYGHFVRRKGLGGGQKKTYVHRYVYACLVGQIPYGHEVHHSCFNRLCCNPHHLSTMTHAENSSTLQGPLGTRITT